MSVPHRMPRDVSIGVRWGSWGLIACRVTSTSVLSIHCVTHCFTGTSTFYLAAIVHSGDVWCRSDAAAVVQNSMAKRAPLVSNSTALCVLSA